MAVSNLFLSSISVAAFLGIASARDAWLEGSIFCARNSERSPLGGATARVVCGSFTSDAVTNEDGHYLKKLPENPNNCVVSLEDPGPNSGNCIVPDPKNSIDIVDTKFRAQNADLYIADRLLYNPLPTAASPIYSALPKPLIPSVKP